MSATTPSHGILTTGLLDPASPIAGSTQVVQNITITPGTVSQQGYVLGRWITKPLPAQTIGTGSGWGIYAAVRNLVTIAGSASLNLWGICVAQWRPGTGIIARGVDQPNGGGVFGNLTNNDAAEYYDWSASSLTLLTNDCLVVELWTFVTMGSVSGVINVGVLLNGTGQYVNGTYATGILANTDAVLVAPVPITFS
jgi:hypothetical protein